MAEERFVELSRSGHEPLEFAVVDTTPQSVASAFDLDVSTVWLKQEFGKRCYFPQVSGGFEFGREVGQMVFSLTVEGAPVSHNTHTVTTATPETSTGNQPYYRPFAKKGQNSTFNVKVVKAILTKTPSGKPEFEKIEQTHVSVTESTANVTTVTNAIQSKWGFSYIVVTGDGLPVDDSSGTQGSKFWRVGSRKFYAIEQKKGKGKKRRQKKRKVGEQTGTDTTSGSDLQSPLPALKRARRDSVQLSQIKDDLKFLPEIKEELESIRGDLNYVNKIMRGMKVPVALKRKLAETFKCNVCHNAPIQPPVIFARCCKAIVGCQTCVDQWYREDGISKKCPLCGTDRALPETMRIHGLDDFLTAVAPLLVDGEET